jgi:hypothetical protein
VDLDSIVERLARYQQRATYGAVGGVLYEPGPVAGRNCGNLLARCPRNPFYSWVVRADDGLPSGYVREEMDPAVYARRGTVIRSAAVLEQWLRSHR